MGSGIIPGSSRVVRFAPDQGPATTLRKGSQMPRIVYVPAGDADRQFATGLVPHGFELIEVSAGSAELHDAMPEADYLVGLGDPLHERCVFCRARRS
jgi:hypothetical protein